MATLEDVLNKLVNPGVAIPGSKSRVEEEAQRQLVLQAAEKARLAQKPAGAVAAAPAAQPAAPVAAAPAPTPQPVVAPTPSASVYSSDKTLQVSEPSAMPQGVTAAAPRPQPVAVRAPAVTAASLAPQVIDTTKIASPFTDKEGRAPEPGSWDALWGAKWQARRADAQNQAVAAAAGAGSAALQAENAPRIAEAGQEAATLRSREQISAQRDISAAEVGQRSEAAKQTAEQLKRQIISVPTGQRLDTSVPGMPMPVNTYAQFVQDDTGKLKQISLDPVRGAASAAPPKAAIDLLKKNPGLAKEFEAKYGPGSAAAVIGK